MASSLRILLKGSEVIAPDVPIEPSEALRLLNEICSSENPDLVTGLSLGGFWAQKLRGRRKILINPDLHPSRLLRTKIGEMKYLSPRKDGAESFFISEALCNEYETLENIEFDGLTPEETALSTGIFADNDELVRCGPEFERFYPGRAHYYPGTHLPNYPELKAYIIPIIENEVPD